MRRLILTCYIAALVAGCATQAKFQAKMDSFIGRSEGALVGAYGPPQGSYTLGDGSRVLQYSRSGQMVLPGATTMQPVTTNTTGNLTLNQGMRQTTGNYNQTSTTYVQQQGPATTVQLGCTVNFTIDASGTVRAWSANGNHCVAN
jgi:hypothetical protein